MRNPFITFTSRSALWAFIICAVVGAASIFRNFYPQWIATLCVVIYSLIVLNAQVGYHISLSQETKNSPYFMGFLLTMWSLFNIFIGIKEIKPATFGSIVVPQIGAAMLTTIAGLVMRHILTTGSIEVSEQEKIFKTATDELQENVNAYKMAQVKLIKLVEEFVSSHQKMMEQLSIASKQHLDLLSESSDALAKLGRQYPTKVQRLLTVFDEILVKLDLFLNSTIPSIDRKISEDISTNMSAIVMKFGKSIEEFLEKIRNGLSGMEKNISEIGNNYNFVFKELPVLQSKILSETENQLQQYRNSTIECLKQRTQDVTEGFEQVKTSITAISKILIDCNVLINNGFEKPLTHAGNQLIQLGATIEKVNESADGMGRSIQETNKSVRAHTELLGNEIKEIDKLIDTFLEVMRRRLH